jgi:hypothetical protein
MAAFSSEWLKCPKCDKVSTVWFARINFQTRPRDSFEQNHVLIDLIQMKVRTLFYTMNECNLSTSTILVRVIMINRHGVFHWSVWFHLTFSTPQFDQRIRGHLSVHIWFLLIPLIIWDVPDLSKWTEIISLIEWKRETSFGELCALNVKLYSWNMFELWDRMFTYASYIEHTVSWRSQRNSHQGGRHQVRLRRGRKWQEHLGRTRIRECGSFHGTVEREEDVRVRWQKKSRNCEIVWADRRLRPQSSSQKHVRCRLVDMSWKTAFQYIFGRWGQRAREKAGISLNTPSRLAVVRWDRRHPMGRSNDLKVNGRLCHI